MAHPKILAFVLAGGRGERLAPLTDMRTKPSVPFGGRCRVDDSGIVIIPKAERRTGRGGL